MYNLLKWQNPNGTITTTVKIYRGDAALDRDNLSNPIATLTNGETQFKDTTAVRGNTYFYVFETISANDRVVSPNYQMTVTPRRGPDPQTLTIGDYTYGYWGSITSANFATATAVRDAAGIAGVSGFALLQTSPKWHKFSRNGKIIMVPEGPLGSGGVTWNTLYGLGLVFGSDGPGPFNNGANVNQSKTITIGPDKYRIRLMTGYSDDFSVFAVAGTVNEPLEGTSNEWDDLVFPLCVWVPTQQRMQNIQNLTLAQLLLTTQCLCADRATSASGNPIVRGSSTASRVGLAVRSNVGPTVSALWWPVLELIESSVVA